VGLAHLKLGKSLHGIHAPAATYQRVATATARFFKGLKIGERTAVGALGAKCRAREKEKASKAANVAAQTKDI